MKLYPDSKVYVICPANVPSGGPELCHQLCSQLIAFNVNAFMLYIPGSYKINYENPVHNFYLKYHLPYKFKLEDSEQNVLIVPEFFSNYLYMTEKIRRIFWWMSVDNYLEIISARINSRLANTLGAPLPKFFYFAKEDGDIEHWVQSEYARQFVALNGVPEDKIFWVEDYLNQAFLSRAAQIDLRRKENFVAFNPQKGLVVTKQLMETAPDIDWRPIQNMTPEQVQELLARAKVYIDFGKHPGKDRIPREAAISGCVVITGGRGAASNDVDINIPAEFKFDEKTSTTQQIVGKIREVFENFAAAHLKQKNYRARILDDKNRFTREVAEAFEIKNFPPPSVALTQSVGTKTFALAQELFQSRAFKPSFIVNDVLATNKISHELILREQNRKFLRVGENFIELITRDDAKFLYREGRIKIFALFEPTDEEFIAVQKFYEPADEDVLIFEAT